MEIAYSNYFREHTDLFYILSDYKKEIINILEEHFEHGCINILTAPELKRIKVNEDSYLSEEMKYK